MMTEVKRILFVVESLFALGPAQQLIPLAKQITTTGVEVHLGVVEYFREESEELEASGVKVHSLGCGPIENPFSQSRCGDPVAAVGSSPPSGYCS